MRTWTNYPGLGDSTEGRGRDRPLHGTYHLFCGRMQKCDGVVPMQEVRGGTSALHDIRLVPT